jgi:two-component system response regulator YesN
MIRILIAEDEMLEMKYLNKILSQNAHFKVVHTASNGKAAVEYVRENTVDIAILDIKMPTMGGLQATEQIKAIDKNIQVIINTAYAEFELAQKALRLGADEYIIKPTKDYILTEIIENLYQNSRQQTQTTKSFDEQYSLSDYPLMEEKTLIGAMHHYDVKLFKRSFNDFMSSLLVSSKDTPIIKHCLKDFISEISRTMVLIGFDTEEANQFKNKTINRLENSISINALKHALLESEQAITEKLLLHDSSTIYQTKNIVKFIQNNFQGDITLKSLSQQFHFSESHLSRCISKETNMSFPHFLNQLRIEHAVHLLENSNLKVSEIANDVGYHDTSHFNRTFKSIKLVTPSAYRSNCKEG